MQDAARIRHSPGVAFKPELIATDEMRSLPLALIALFICAGVAEAQSGPGLGNLSYAPAEVFTPVGYIQSPRGHGNVTMVQGYLMVIYSSDGGGDETNGGIEFWDIHDPRAPVRAIAYDNAETHGLREAHGFSLAWYEGQLLLAAQGEEGILIFDVTDPMAVRLVSFLDLPGIERGDYSGDWWLFWQAPYIYVAGVDSGLYVVDARDPAAPVLAAQVPTGELGGVSPAQVFVVGNLAVIMETQGSAIATLDVATPDQPVLLRQASGRSGYSNIFAGDGKILTSGNIPPRAHILQVTPEGEISLLNTIGFFFNSGGYGSYQDGYFHSGFSNNYVKFDIDPPQELGNGSSGRADRDEDFAAVLGNIVFAGDDHGVGTALIPHQEAPDGTPPVVEWMHPPAGSTAIALTSRFGLSFSDHIDAASLTSANIRLEDDTGATVPARLSAQMGLVNIAPLAELGLLRTYKVVAENVRDLAGNPSPRFEATVTAGDGSIPLAPTAAVQNVDVSIAFGSYALGIFAEGKKIYSDRDYEFTAQFPPRFDRQAYVQTANVDKNNFLSNFLSFDLLAPAEVAVLYDSRATSIPNWMGNFTPTGETVATTDAVFDVYTARYPAGSVTLGGNGALGSNGAQSMYSVVIVPEPVPCEVDLAPALTGTITLSAIGPPNGSYEWRVAERSLSGPSPSIYLPPGRHPISLRVNNGVLGASCSGVKIVHRPLVAEPARVASRMIFAGGHTIHSNADQGTVTRIDPLSGRAVYEARVGGTPETLAIHGSELWVVDGARAKIAVLDAATGAAVKTIDLPYGSAPFGLVRDAGGGAYLTLSATGEVVRLSADGAIAARKFVAPTVHGLTDFQGRLYVTRFISPDERGEVYVLDRATLDILDTIELGFDPGPDNEAAGRGVPNYLAEVTISPDGYFGFVPGKKDNIARGLYRDGQLLTFESRVRTAVSLFEVATSSAPVSARLDINDRDLIQSTLVSPLGDLLFVASLGVNIVDVFDVAKRERVTQFEVGLAPQAMALDPATQRLAVYNFLSRSVGYYDVSGLLNGTSNAAVEIATISAVAGEALDPLLLQGKIIFHNAADDRMSRDGYISCASCHLGGGHDGRVWDFTQAGEGLRNTISLNGRAGLGHGRVHWTANFDEIQDFENDIREAFGGTGFLSDENFAATRDPLGARKAGLSPELDALAAYVSSLARTPPSPHRAADGSLTLPARRGRVVFNDAGCASCHGGIGFQDGARYDVGTIGPGSGQGIGAPLAGVGFETPTLLGLFDTAPYFHDGSAATLAVVLDRHGMIPAISGGDRDDLLAYLLQLDSDALAPGADCAGPPHECVDAMMPPMMDGGVIGEPDGGVIGPGPSDSGVAAPDAGVAVVKDGGCGCNTAGTPGERRGIFGLLLLLALGFGRVYPLRVRGRS